MSRWPGRQQDRGPGALVSSLCTLTALRMGHFRYESEGESLRHCESQFVLLCGYSLHPQSSYTVPETAPMVSGGSRTLQVHGLHAQVISPWASWNVDPPHLMEGLPGILDKLCITGKSDPKLDSANLTMLYNVFISSRFPDFFLLTCKFLVSTHLVPAAALSAGASWATGWP